MINFDPSVKTWQEDLRIEKPKYIDVEGIKLEVESIRIGHSICYINDINGNRICKEFITRMWKVKEIIPLDISKYHTVNYDGGKYICYISGNRKALIETQTVDRK